MGKVKEGITPTALVITMLILLILAGVSIKNQLNTSDENDKVAITEDLNVKELDSGESTIKFKYTALELRDENNVHILIQITEDERGIKQVDYPNNENTIYCNGKNKLAIDYTVELGTEYKFKIISESLEEKEYIVIVNEFYYKVITHLGTGATINNTASMLPYNESYQAKITIGDIYVIDTMNVTMGGIDITSSVVNKTEGIINIPQVTGDITVTVTTKYITAKYLLFEVYDHLAGNSASINEIEIYGVNNEIYSYNVLPDLVSDRSGGSKPHYWNDSAWGRWGLNDGMVPTGKLNSGVYSTIFLYQSSAGSGKWARFIIKFRESLPIGNIKVNIGDKHKRPPARITAYSIDNFIDGTGTGSTYDKNVKNRDDSGLNKIRERTFTTINDTPVWYNL